MDEAVATADPTQQDALDAVIQKAQEVNVCITADATTFSNPTSLRLLHFVNANWEDITRSVDSATQTVCGVTTSLSPFVVVEPVSSVDTTPPVLSNVPADRTVTATGPDGAVVTYALPTATDGVDGPLPVTCAPASGTTFRIGTTRVTCTATDAAGNTASASFNVTVTGLQSAVTVRLVSSTGAGLPGGSVEYFARGWQPLGSTGADGTLETSLAPSPGNTRFRITYAGGRAVVVQNTAESPVVIFTTVSVTVELRDSSGNALNAEHVEFHAGEWEPFGSGLTPATGQLLPGMYSFRVSYAGGRQTIRQNIGENPLVVFQTGAVVSQSGAAVEYNAGGWQPFSQGIELLPGTYRFRFNNGTPVTSCTIEPGVTNTIP